MTQKTHAAGEPATTRPMTGDEYLESPKDRREVYIFGERVKDVTSHPAFRNSARMTARLYDAMQNPARNSPLAVPTICSNRAMRLLPGSASATAGKAARRITKPVSLPPWAPCRNFLANMSAMRAAGIKNPGKSSLLEPCHR